MARARAGAVRLREAGCAWQRECGHSFEEKCTPAPRYSRKP